MQTAEGMAEWAHARVRSDLGSAGSGPPLLVGIPRVPRAVRAREGVPLLDAPSIGLRLSGGFAVEPEQSTLAIVAHHPQAIYFGMRSGSLPETDRQAADELIAGTEKDPTRLSELTDADPEPVAEERGPAGHRPRPDALTSEPGRGAAVAPGGSGARAA